MKIATWNVNSLKVRLPHVLEWMDAEAPDVLAVQETKVADENFPLEEIQAHGYHAAFTGQKSYNGVALLSRRPVENVVVDIPGIDAAQRRIIAADVGPVRVLNLYVVNGQEVGSEKYHYKLEWLDRVRRFVAGELERSRLYAVVGDFNIAPEDRDIHDPEAWRERIHASTPEREALQALLGLGLTDAFRLFEQPERAFSWWDYRAAAFRRNLGLRIDLILLSEALAPHCTACRIDREPRRRERPSDHAPVVAELDLDAGAAA